MQEQVNEKTVALYIKTGKLTAEMLQRAMKKLLSQMKKQADRPPHGKQTLKQLKCSSLWATTRKIHNDTPLSP